MRDARGATAADRMHDWNWHQSWKPPPLSRRCRPRQEGGILKENLGNGSGDTYRTPAEAAQRHVDRALRHADRLERRAALAAEIGLREAPERLKATAARLREVAR